MKKLSIVYCLLVLLITLYSCSNTCDLRGCDKQATGWKYYETHQKGPFGGCIGACRMSDSGGYCSKRHALKGR